MQKILGVAFTSTTSKSEAFITTYEETVRQENPLERVASNLSSNSSFTFGAFNNENRLVGVVTLLTEEKTHISIKDISLQCMWILKIEEVVLHVI